MINQHFFHFKRKVPSQGRKKSVVGPSWNRCGCPRPRQTSFCLFFAKKSTFCRQRAFKSFLVRRFLSELCWLLDFFFLGLFDFLGTFRENFLLLLLKFVFWADLLFLPRQKCNSEGSPPWEACSKERARSSQAIRSFWRRPYWTITSYKQKFESVIQRHQKVGEKGTKCKMKRIAQENIPEVKQQAKEDVILSTQRKICQT